MIIDHRVGDSLYLQNTTSENTAGGRETGIGFFGRVDLATDEYHYTGAIRSQHEGTGADQKGYMTFFTNDGDDNRAIQERMRIASDGKIGINESAPAGLISTKGTLTTQLSGTVTATNGSATVEGSGTDFKNELEWGSSIKILAEVFTVLSITDDDTLVLDSTYAGSTAASLAYYTDPPAFDFRTGDDKPLFEAISTQQFHLGTSSNQGLKLGNTLFPNDDNAQSENTGFGVSLGNLTTGTGNVLFGQSVLSTKTGSSASNVCVGRMIMSSSGGESSDNTIMGNAAGTIVAGGDGNCFFGHTAGNAVTTGSNNVSIGKGSDCVLGADNQIAIGFEAATTAANQIMLGNHRTTDMTMDTPPITVKQTSTSGFGISLEHEGSATVIAALGEDGDGGWLNLSKAGTTEVKLLCSGSSFVGADTSRNFGIGNASPSSSFHNFGETALHVQGVSSNSSSLSRG